MNFIYFAFYNVCQQIKSVYILQFRLQDSFTLYIQSATLIEIIYGSFITVVVFVNLAHFSGVKDIYLFRVIVTADMQQCSVMVVFYRIGMPYRTE